MLTRRQLIHAFLAAPTAAVVPRALQAEQPISSLNNKKLVWINLRGALDGLNSLVPIGDPDYASLRPTLAFQRKPLIDLSHSLFALHPNLRFIHTLYQQKQAAFFSATATSYRARSHFDAQKVLENGVNDPTEAEGWLNRVIQEKPDLQLLAVDNTVPLVAKGQAGIKQWYPSDKQQAPVIIDKLLSRMYADDPHLFNLHQASIDLHAVDQDQQGKFKPLQPSYQASFFDRFLSDHADILCYDLGGYDTHANQGVTRGRLANRLRLLDEVIQVFYEQSQKLSPQQWRNTVIVITSEFGRTAIENGSGGTDHGTGGLTMVLGGAINGGKIHADWPGLSRSSLYLERDLKPTRHVHSIFKSVLQDHLSLSTRQLNRVFPDSRMIKPFQDLLI